MEETAKSRQVPPRPLRLGYNLFIFALSIFSLIVMVASLLPLSDSALQLIRFYDNLICVFFLIDFIVILRAAPNKSHYFLKEGGWLDLVGSLPALGSPFRLSSLLRLARLSRIARILRLVRGKNRADYVNDILENRSQYTALITILVAIIVLATASVLVLEFESVSPDANIITGWDALWYSIVTITTVGYGDFYPVTFWGRATAIFIMIAGVGIIGVLASLLSSALIGNNNEPKKEEAPGPGVEQELSEIKAELANLREILEKISLERDR